MIRISVVVCTYNRANMLKETLHNLIEQTLDKRLYEIIVVDNASTDNTREMVQEIQTNNPTCNIVPLYEAVPGLGRARNTGFRYAQGDYVAFIDDDAKATTSWLETALHCFEEVQPPPLGVGGPILPLYEAPKPSWFKDAYEVRTWGEEPRFLEQGESFSGSNMILRKDTLQTYGGFDERVGVRGKHLSVGEETWLFKRLWQTNSGARVLWYSPQLIVFHSVPHYKMTVSYPLRRAFAAGQAYHIHHGPGSISARLRLLPNIVILMAKRGRLALMQRREFPAYQNWIVEGFAPVALEMGRLASCLGLPIRLRQG